MRKSQPKKLAFPEILASDLKDQSVYESTPVKFEIVAQGIPKLEAQWTLNDKPLKADDHFNITNDGLKYTLEIADVKLSDAGQFKVVVKNKLGEQAKQCELSVMRMYKYIFEIYFTQISNDDERHDFRYSYNNLNLYRYQVFDQATGKNSVILWLVT